MDGWIEIDLRGEYFIGGSQEKAQSTSHGTKRKPQRQSETCDWLSGLQVNRMNLQLGLRSAEPGSIIAIVGVSGG